MTHAPPAIPPTLIPLPGGLSVSGVSMFAVRLAGALAEAGGRVTLALHAPGSDAPALAVSLPGGVATLDLTHLPPIDRAGGDVRPYLPAYRDAVAGLAADGEPVSVLLGQHDGVFAIAAALSQAMPELIRPVGVAHSDNSYDADVLRRYAPLLHRLVAVSDTLEAELVRLVQDPPGRVTQIPYGVHVPAEPVRRAPLGSRPLRLLYSGRFEHRQKRVLALPALAGELAACGIEHAMTIVGDGPADAELRAACAERPTVTVLAPRSPDVIGELLDTHDAFVLPSRYEGLSVSMLEALARGCVPVCTPSRSGTAQAIRPGITGEIADVDPEGDERAAAVALADAFDALRRRDLREMAARSHADARERFSIERHASAWIALLRSLPALEPRPWPTDRPCSLRSGGDAGRAAGRSRLRRVLAELGDRPVCIHGTGSTARALAAELADANVLAVCDDDRQAQGTRFLGWPVIEPAAAGATGARDLIILAALHEDAIWARRGVYERQNMRVHRLIGGEPAEPAQAASAR